MNTVFAFSCLCVFLLQEEKQVFMPNHFVLVTNYAPLLFFFLNYQPSCGSASHGYHTHFLVKLNAPSMVDTVCYILLF